MAIRRRLLTIGRLPAEVDRHRQLVQRPGLARLVGRLEAGCRSELELWGHERVSTGPRFEELERQVLVTVPLAEPVGADGPRLRLELPHRS